MINNIHDLSMPAENCTALAKRNGLINRIAEDAWDGTPHSSWNWLVYWTSSFKLRCRDVLNTFGGYKESDTHFAISCRDRSNESHHDLIKLFCEIFIFLHLNRKKIISWPPVRQPFTLWNSLHDQAPVRQNPPRYSTGVQNDTEKVIRERKCCS